MVFLFQVGVSVNKIPITSLGSALFQTAVLLLIVFQFEVELISLFPDLMFLRQLIMPVFYCHEMKL
jgi:hypothetical protein